jgi:hypothetical protein
VFSEEQCGLIVRVQIEVVLEVLEGTQNSWTQIGIDDKVCPPARTLKGLGSLEQLTGLHLSARHALVEKLLATLEYDWSFLDRLTWNLEERGVRSLCLALTLPSGGREWCEVSFSQFGLWQSLDQLFGHTAVRSISSRSILATSKPYG